MKEVAISEFKAKCLGMLEEVLKTGKPIRVTRFGKPVAEAVASYSSTPPQKLAGVHGWKHRNRGRHCRPHRQF